MLVDMEVMGITMEEKEMIKSLSEEIDVNVDEGRGF